MNKLQQDAMAYQRAQRVLDSLKRNRLELTKAEYKTLRQLALSGDVDGADKALAKMLLDRRGI